MNNEVIVKKYKFKPTHITVPIKKVYVVVKEDESEK
jgi:hypothetical protein